MADCSTSDIKQILSYKRISSFTLNIPMSLPNAIEKDIMPLGSPRVVMGNDPPSWVSSESVDVNSLIT